MTDLVLEHPHVHEWVHEDGPQRSRRYRGQVDTDSPAIRCLTCPDTAGRWGDVLVTLSIQVDVSMTVAEVWPDGDWPVPLTAEAVAAVLVKAGRSEVLDDWGLMPMPLEVDVRVGRQVATARL